MTNEEKAVKLISEAAKLLGWNVIIPNSSDDVNYIVICKDEVADSIAEKLEK